MIWPFSWLHTVGPHSSGQYSGGPLCSSHQQAIWNTVQTFPESVRFERVLQPIYLAYMLPQRSTALVFVSSAWSSQAVCLSLVVVLHLNHSCHLFFCSSLEQVKNESGFSVLHQSLFGTSELSVPLQQLHPAIISQDNSIKFINGQSF